MRNHAHKRIFRLGTKSLKSNSFNLKAKMKSFSVKPPAAWV